jgi:hypothetical protein
MLLVAAKACRKADAAVAELPTAPLPNPSSATAAAAMTIVNFDLMR